MNVLKIRYRKLRRRKHSILKEYNVNNRKKVCGISKLNRNKKQTNWWNQEIKEQTKWKVELLITEKIVKI